jgi:hypothetical protein
VILCTFYAKFPFFSVNLTDFMLIDNRFFFSMSCHNFRIIGLVFINILYCKSLLKSAVCVCLCDFYPINSSARIFRIQYKRLSKVLQSFWFEPYLTLPWLRHLVTSFLHRGSGLIPCQSMCVWFWTKWHWDFCFSM